MFFLVLGNCKLCGESAVQRLLQVVFMIISRWGESRSVAIVFQGGCSAIREVERDPVLRRWIAPA